MLILSQPNDVFRALLEVVRIVVSFSQLSGCGGSASFSAYPVCCFSVFFHLSVPSAANSVIIGLKSTALVAFKSLIHHHVQIVYAAVTSNFYAFSVDCMLYSLQLYVNFLQSVNT